MLNSKMAWQLHPYGVLLLISAIPLAVIAVVAWRRRGTISVRFFFWFIAFLLGLVVSYSMELFSANIYSIMFWLRWEYFFQWSIIFWFLFVVAYVGLGGWLRRRFLTAVFIIPVVTLICVWTNGMHGLIWATVGTQTIEGLVMFDRSYGPVFWVWMAYVYSLLIIACTLLIFNLLRWPRVYRGQAMMLVIGMVLPWAGNMLTIARITPFPLLDLVPFGIALTSIPVALSLFRFRLLDLLPAAHGAAMESISDPVIVVDDQSRVVELNQSAQQLIGLENNAIVGKPVHDFFANAHVWPVVRPGMPEAHAEWSYNSQGKPRTFDLRISPLSDRLGSMSGQVVVMRDITERKQAEQQALELAVEREKVAMLERFIQDASHDFRSPITVLKTSTYLQQKFIEQARLLITVPAQGVDAPDGSTAELAALIARIEEKVQSTENSAERLSQIVESMLEITRLEDAGSFDFAPCDLNALVRNSLLPYQKRLADTGLTLRVETDPKMPQIQADEFQLGRALGRLLDNAIQYTPSGGTITIATRHDDQQAVLEVRDTGIGISLEDQPHIFERFFRADTARSMATGGAGLGLAIARRVVEAHKGRVKVESTPNAGSTFHIELPL